MCHFIQGVSLSGNSETMTDREKTSKEYRWMSDAIRTSVDPYANFRFFSLLQYGSAI